MELYFQWLARQVLPFALFGRSVTLVCLGYQHPPKASSVLSLAYKGDVQR
jgi:hypothetical protein